jgi:hypothetical protein
MASLEALSARLSQRAAILHGPAEPRGYLPRRSARPVEANAEGSKQKDGNGESLKVQVAQALRLAEQGRGTAEAERRKAQSLQAALVSTQDALKRVTLAMQAEQYELEAWRRKALLLAQAGQPAQVVAALDELPQALKLEEDPAGRKRHRDSYLFQEPVTLFEPSEEVPLYGNPDDTEEAKLRCFAPRLMNPLMSRPPGTTIGDAPLDPSALDDIGDFKPLRDLFTQGGARGSVDQTVMTNEQRLAFLEAARARRAAKRETQKPGNAGKGPRRMGEEDGDPFAPREGDEDEDDQEDMMDKPGSVPHKDHLATSPKREGTAESSIDEVKREQSTEMLRDEPPSPRSPPEVIRAERDETHREVPGGPLRLSQAPAQQTAKGTSPRDEILRDSVVPGGLRSLQLSQDTGGADSPGADPPLAPRGSRTG